MDTTGVSIAIVTVASALSAAYVSRFVSEKNRVPRHIKGGAHVGDSLEMVRVAFKEGGASITEDRASYKGDRESYERESYEYDYEIGAYYADFPHNDIYWHRIMYPIDLRPDGTVVFLRSIEDSSGNITSWALDAVPLKYFRDPRRRKLVHQIIPIFGSKFNMSSVLDYKSYFGVAPVGINQVDGFIYVISGNQVFTIPYEFSSTEKLPSRIDGAFVTKKHSLVDPGQVTWLFKEGGDTDSLLHVYIENRRLMYGYSTRSRTKKIDGHKYFSFETQYGEDYCFSWVDQDSSDYCVMILETGDKMSIWDEYGYFWVDKKMLVTNKDELSKPPTISKHIRYIFQENLEDAEKNTGDDTGLSMYTVPLTGPSAPI